MKQIIFVFWRLESVFNSKKCFDWVFRILFHQVLSRKIWLLVINWFPGTIFLAKFFTENLVSSSIKDIYFNNHKYVNYGEFSTDGVFIVYSTITDEYVGICFTWLPKRESKYGQLNWLCVKPHHPNKGIGKYLAFKVISYIKDLGMESVFLTTENIRTKAIKTYKKFGFVEEYEKPVEILE